jgi:hypothetical protein
MSESKSIIDLCRSLPNSEPELRARADEFCLEIEKHVQVPTAWRRRDYVNNIADAKAATDTILSKKESWMLIGYDGQYWRVQMRGVIDEWQVYVRATTEELARSAACVLAVDAMRQSAK